MLTPCCIIDNPDILREAAKIGNAKPTHTGAETIIKSPEIINHLDNYSKKMHELSDSDWCSKRYKQWKTPWDQKRKNEYW